MDKILSFISIGIYVFLIFCRTSTAADTLIFKHGSFQLGFLNTGVYRRLLASTSGDYCDNDGLCGANGMCDISNSQVCSCLKGFKPKRPEKWNLGEYTEGCVRPELLKCQIKVGFMKYAAVKLPDITNSWVNQSMSLMECRASCLSNCSCMAYSSSGIKGEGSGCTIWFGDLINIRKLLAGGQDLYIRMPASELSMCNRFFFCPQWIIRFSIMYLFNHIACWIHYIISPALCSSHIFHFSCDLTITVFPCWNYKDTNCRKTKIAVIVVSIASIVSGMLLAVCCICRKSSKFKGNISSITTFFAFFFSQLDIVKKGVTSPFCNAISWARILWCVLI